MICAILKCSVLPEGTHVQLSNLFLDCKSAGGLEKVKLYSTYNRPE